MDFELLPRWITDSLIWKVFYYIPDVIMSILTIMTVVSLAIFLVRCG